MDQPFLAGEPSGDLAGAFEHLFRSEYPGLFRYARRWVRDTDVAEELVQEVFVALWEGRGRLLVRGTPAKTYEAGLNQRCVVIEFDNLEKAIATYESPEYQAAKKLLEGSVERDVRMVDGA